MYGRLRRLPFLRGRNPIRFAQKALSEISVPPSPYTSSPLITQEELEAQEAEIFKPFPHSLPGIDLNEAEQLELLTAFAGYYKDLPFSAEKQEGLRYFFENPMYSYSDAICLYCMIRHVKPQRIIEVGCGYSSCAALDTNELFFDNNIRCTFIDPYTDVLLRYMKPGDQGRHEIIPTRVQEVALEKFQALAANDILFIDSSHVCKVNSDVNFLLFSVLPSLKTGVYVHFHDVFYPFEYPRQWIYERWPFTEDYLLRAFLQYNRDFKIVFFNTFLEHFHEERFRREMPLCLQNPGGSIWLQKVEGPG